MSLMKRRAAPQPALVRTSSGSPPGACVQSRWRYRGILSAIAVALAISLATASELTTGRQSLPKATPVSPPPGVTVPPDQPANTTVPSAAALMKQAKDDEEYIEQPADDITSRKANQSSGDRLAPSSVASDRPTLILPRLDNLFDLSRTVRRPKPSDTDSGPDVVEGSFVYAKPPAKSADAMAGPMTIDGMEAMVVPKGYPLERHDVVSDGYKIVNFRIPYGAQGPRASMKFGAGPVYRQPILLLHGISLSSTCWVLNDPEESLAFILADQGYDVWMWNTRGNTFSREHERYTTDDSRFWRFCMDELALVDLPQVINYILMVTGAKKLPLVTHSQGGAIAIAMLTRPRPAGGQHPVSLVVNLGPVVYVTFMKSVTLAAFCVQTNASYFLANMPPSEFYFMGRTTQTMFLSGVCQQVAAAPACRQVTESLFGDSDHITNTQYRRCWQQWPSATSSWNPVQWSQLYNEVPPAFREFNGGPEYDLTKITNPIFTIAGGKDVMSAPEDIELSNSRLKQAGVLRGVHVIPDYGHMDFIWDREASKTCYPHVSDALDRFAF